MAARSDRTAPLSPKPESGSSSAAKVSAEAALSFLKDTKGAVSWGLGEMAGILKIGRKEAEQVVAFLAAQGYVAQAEGEKNAWLTTAAGESVSGAKTPRFGRKNVEEAVEFLKGRIREINTDKGAPYRFVKAVAFGDFLLADRPKLQAADVGIQLASRGERSELRSASDAKEENRFLKDLRGKVQLLNVRPYADWMSRPSHVPLM